MLPPNVGACNTFIHVRLARTARYIHDRDRPGSWCASAQCYTPCVAVVTSSNCRMGFRRADAPLASEPDLLAVAYRSPVAIVCCRSAAAVHELSDDSARVQIAVPTGHRPPRIAYPPTEVFRFAANTFEVELSRLEAAPGEWVRIYTPARTVIDLMRLRHRFGSRWHSPRCSGTCADVTRHQRSCSTWHRCLMWRDRSAVRSTWPRRNEPSDAQYCSRTRLLDLQRRARAEGRS